MVEIAIVLPVFLLLVLGILYFSIYYYSGQTAQFLAQKAVLSAMSVDPASSNSKDLIQEQVQQRLTQLSKTSPGYIGLIQSAIGNGDGKCGGKARGAYICVNSRPDPERYHVTVHLVSYFSDIWPGFPDLISFLAAVPDEQVRIEGNASVDVYGRQVTS